MDIIKLLGNTTVKVFGLSLVIGALLLGGYYYISDNGTAGDYMQNAINDHIETFDNNPVKNTPVKNLVNENPQNKVNVPPTQETTQPTIEEPVKNDKTSTEADASKD